MNLSWDYSESNLSEMRRVSTQMQEPDFGSFSQSHAISKPKSKAACKFYMSGKCSFGSRCQFSHVISRGNDSSTEYCSFYRSGHCKYGSSCALKHGNEPEIPDLTFSMKQLDFDSNSSLSNTRSEGRNSLLPSFLVDELLLDDDEHHQNHHESSHKEEHVVFYERTSSITPPVTLFEPTSYGEAIAVGLKQNQNNLNTSESFFTIQPSEREQSLLPLSTASQDRSNVADELCAFSIMGKCRYGAFCRNVHGLQCPRCLLYVLHPTDMERNEDHLNECLSKPESVPFSELHQILCGLCHEPILQGVDPRFGLLNCNHAFCLACIRNWRSTHFDANNENSRSCPECKEVTYFIVPSSTWIDDHVEKFKVIEQYKKRMSVIPCKYYDYGRGDCPFGTSCFYEHRVETADRSGAPRSTLIIDHREQIAKVRDAKLSDYIVFKTAPARNKKK